jgi:hypothetical protein
LTKLWRLGVTINMSEYTGVTLLVTGSRDWEDVGVVGAALTKAIKGWGVTHLVHGDARGADRLAARCAAWCLGPDRVKAFPADWKKHGKAAGVLRNQQMLREANPDVCLAFSATPITRGTQDMVNRCLRAGVPTFHVTPDGLRKQLDIEHSYSSAASVSQNNETPKADSP